MKLEDHNWKVFRLEDIFECTKGVYLPTETVIDGNIPFVTAKVGNNGINRFIGNGILFDGNKITIEKIRLSAYYQPCAFYCSHDVSVVWNEHINRFNAHFIAAMIMRNGSKYSYGRQAQLNVVKRESIMLPVTEKGEPDYQFMEDYIRELIDIKRKQYKDFVDKQVNRIKLDSANRGGGYSNDLNSQEWKLFRIGDLFTVKRPIARNKDDYSEGNIPFVASGAINNGVMKCCEPKTGETLDKGKCITVSPVDGSSFYQPSAFLGRGGAGSSVLMLYNDNINCYSGQFISRMIFQTCSKYTYGHMGNKDSISREYVQLPVTSDGEPDYIYMELFEKRLMVKKYSKYLSFLARNLT